MRDLRIQVPLLSPWKDSNPEPSSWFDDDDFERVINEVDQMVQAEIDAERENELRMLGRRP